MLVPQYYFILLFLLPPLNTQQALTPGFQFLGKGYDCFLGNILDTSGGGDPGWREQIFKFTTAQGKKTVDNLWLVPDNTESTSISACSSDQQESIVNDGFDYQHSVSTGFGIDLSLFGAAFQFSVESKHITQTTISGESIYAQLEANCAVYQLGMNYYLSPEVSDEFLYGVKTLSDEYDEEAYMTFLQVFGTHYIRTLRLGGKWGWLIEMNRKDFQKLLDDEVDWNMGLQYAGKIKSEEASGGFNANGSDVTKTVAKVMDAVYHNYTYNIGGDYKPDSESWMQSVRANPMPIYIDPLPLWGLLSSRFLPSVPNLVGKQSLLKNATLNYCKWLEQHSDSAINCTRPNPLPKPVPHPVDSKAIRGICIKNQGGYAMSWKLLNMKTTGVFAESDVFPNGQMRCLDGMQVNSENGQFLGCTIDIVGGKQDFSACGLPYLGGKQYDERSVLSAVYVCSGSTMGPSCSFEGFAQ